MSFDDLFSLFWPTLAMRPPSNAVALAALLNAMINIELSPPFQFARTIFMSAVEYTTKVKEQDVETN
jgi:hypothetical protein